MYVDVYWNSLPMNIRLAEGNRANLVHLNPNFTDNDTEAQG
jgi:hypothetical protein